MLIVISRGIFGADFGFMGSMGIKAGTTTCRCHGQTSWNGAGAGIGMHVRTATNEAWCACGCLLVTSAGGGVTEHQVIVTIGQNVVLVGLDKVDPNSKDYICIRKNYGNIRKL